MRCERQLKIRIGAEKATPARRKIGLIAKAIYYPRRAGNAQMKHLSVDFRGNTPFRKVNDSEKLVFRVKDTAPQSQVDQLL